MINPLSSVSVTNPVTSFEPHISPVTRLSRPYHYRRNGIYYLRLRVTGSTSRTVSVSLHTTDRRIAMDASNDLADAVRVFHLGCPEATWHQLRESLVQSAASLLKTSLHSDTQRLWGGLYGNVGTRHALAKNDSAPFP